MRIKIARQNNNDLLIQRFADDEEELDDVTVISNTELLKLMQFVKAEVNGDWSDVLEYLADLEKKEKEKLWHE